MCTFLVSAAVLYILTSERRVATAPQTIGMLDCATEHIIDSVGATPYAEVL